MPIERDELRWSVSFKNFSAEEMFHTVANEWFSAYIAVCAFAGLRRGEASALRVPNVDFLRKEILVSRQVQWADDGRWFAVLSRRR